MEDNSVVYFDSDVNIGTNLKNNKENLDSMFGTIQDSTIYTERI